MVESSGPSYLETALKDVRTLGEAVRQIDKLLSRRGIPEAHLEAELLVSHALDTDRTHLLSCLEEIQPPGALDRLVPLMERRLRREPLAYLLGWREFYGLRLSVRPGVLIPRQETETLVEEAVRLAKERYGGSPAIADVGCGSGAIAVALAAHLPKARISALDKEPISLEVTAQNCQQHRVQDRVTLLQGDLLAPLAEPVDIVIANLPYLCSGYFVALQPEVLHEPREALDGGTDGLQVIFRLMNQLHAKVKQGGAVLMECDPRQAKHLKQQAHDHYPDSSIRVLQDLAHLDRAVELLL